MGRRPKPTDRIRIPRELYEEIQDQARQEGIDTNQLAERWLRFAKENEGKVSAVQLLGRIDALIAKKTRRK